MELVNMLLSQQQSKSSGECVRTSLYLHLEIVPCEECCWGCKQLRLQAFHYLQNLLYCSGYIISNILFHTRSGKKERDWLYGLHNKTKQFSVVFPGHKKCLHIQIGKLHFCYAHLYKTFYYPCKEMCDKNLEYFNTEYPPFM
jgi:hypothetical protein